MRRTDKNAKKDLRESYVTYTTDRGSQAVSTRVINSSENSLKLTILA